MNEDSRNAVLGLMRSATDDVSSIANRIRLAIIALIFLRLVVFVGDEMLAGEFKHWLTTGFLVLGALASFGLTRASGNSMETDTRLMASTLLDAVIATLVVLPSVLWPRETHLGVLRAPDILIFPVVAAAGGLRLTYRAAATGAASAIAGLGLLVAIDQLQNAAVIRYGFAEILLAAAVMIGAGLLALGTVRFVEKLILQTATRTTEAVRVRTQFGAYMAEEFAQIVLDTPGQPAARRVHVAVLFSDLRGFTQYSEGADPNALIEELNAYLAAVVDAVHAYGGVVDKYIGDSVMAVFGLPTPRDDDHTRAILAAFAMQEALAVHNQRRAQLGLPPLRQGIGVHAGEVVAGPVGSAERLQYTVLGDTVNVAARLETETKSVGSPILLSAAVVEGAIRENGELPELAKGPSLQLRGRTEAVRTYVPAGEVGV
ncbi:MAG: adenylate/guanylate cyclase domain-containing protein [Myxococcota bacterium]